jgi:hypothetical protein
MKVTQLDSRTARVLPDSGVPFLVPYRFFWNGHDRQAESIVLTGPEERRQERPRESARGTSSARGASRSRGAYEVRAFFLFGEIRDRISADKAGIVLHRSWSVKTPGSLRLSIDLEFDAPAAAPGGIPAAAPGGIPAAVRSMFPGVHAADGVPDAPISFLGEKTSYPGSLSLSMGEKGVLLYSRSADCGGTPAGIGIGRTEIEDEAPRLRVELRFPGVEEPSARTGPRPEHLEPPGESVIESPGTLERSHEIYLSFSGREGVFIEGTAAVVSRLLPRLSGTPASAPTVDLSLMASALQASLVSHLWQQRGVVGLREVPGSPWLSSSAGAGLALAMRKLFPGDARLQELALRLADFSLKGQVPSGLFYESFHAVSGEWRGVRGQAKRTLLSVGQSSRVAELLLMLAADLEGDGKPFEKYYLSGLRFVEFFLDEKARFSMPGSLHAPGDRVPVSQSPDSLGGLELFFPMAMVRARTGRDRYKKALDLLVRRFSALPWDSFHPPGSRDGRGPDSAGALLATRLFIEMRAMGYRPVEPPDSRPGAAKVRSMESARLFASLLVPWIRVHPSSPDPGPPISHAGGLVESFVRQRIVFAGFEAALLLLDLAQLLPASEGRQLLKRLARLCLGSARPAPLGTAFVQHTRWDDEGKAEAGRGRYGPVDSRRLASELLAGLRLADDYPKL